MHALYIQYDIYESYRFWQLTVLVTLMQYFNPKSTKTLVNISSEIKRFHGVYLLDKPLFFTRTNILNDRLILHDLSGTCNIKWGEGPAFQMIHYFCPSHSQKWVRFEPWFVEVSPHSKMSYLNNWTTNCALGYLLTASPDPKLVQGVGLGQPVLPWCKNESCCRDLSSWLRPLPTWQHEQPSTSRNVIAVYVGMTSLGDVSSKISHVCSKMYHMILLIVILVIVNWEGFAHY